jgi:hypothetical protein
VRWTSVQQWQKASPEPSSLQYQRESPDESAISKPHFYLEITTAFGATTQKKPAARPAKNSSDRESLDRGLMLDDQGESKS